MNALGVVERLGCPCAHIVTGYLSERLRQVAGEGYGRVNLRYVENPKYASTNSMYSLALALRTLPPQDACWVIEGDVFMEEAMLLGFQPQAPITWFVDSSIKTLDGSYVSSTEGFARRAEIVRDISLLEDDQCKSTGILFLKADGITLISDWLEEGIIQGQENDYYDKIIASKLPGSRDVRTFDVAGNKWFEIDSAEDLKVAERLFGQPRGSGQNCMLYQRAPSTCPRRSESGFPKRRR